MPIQPIETEEKLNWNLYQKCSTLLLFTLAILFPCLFDFSHTPYSVDSKSESFCLALARALNINYYIFKAIKGGGGGSLASIIIQFGSRECYKIYNRYVPILNVKKYETRKRVYNTSKFVLSVYILKLLQ